MKVYVDNGKLESHDIQSITDLGGKEFQQVRMWFKDTDNVEIVSLSDYTKQVRKEVIGQVRDIARKIARPTTEYDGGEFDYDVDGVTLDNLLIWLEDEEIDLLKNFLDQIQGEINTD